MVSVGWGQVDSLAGVLEQLRRFPPLKEGG
jgi:hypothetical protein